MSIPAYIKALEAEGKLRPFIPPGPDKPRRRLYLAEQAQADFDKPDSAMNMLVGKGYMAGAMSRWVLGNRVHGNKKRGLFIDRLCSPPPEIWEMRITEPNVQGRGFGRFGAQDTLILTHFRTRPALKGKGAVSWAADMKYCEAAWNQLFPGMLFTRPSIGDYVSENYDDFPLCP